MSEHSRQHAPGLAETQAAWSDYLRTPTAGKRPSGTPVRPMALYAQLLRTNIGGFVDRCFPICRAVLGEASWKRLIDRFFAEAHWHHSPHFHEIPLAFVRFLDEGSEAQGGSAALATFQLPPWYAELAHYEWLELAVETAADRPARCGPQGMALAPVCELAAYAWPVHTISVPDDLSDVKEAAAQRVKPASQVTPEASFIAVFRNRDEQVRFSVLTPAAAQLLHVLQDNGCDWEAALCTLAVQWAQPLAHLQAQTEGLKRQWLQDGLLRAEHE